MFESGRREFLKTALWAASLGSAVHPREAMAAEESQFWDAIRGQFPFTEEKVPMNAANLCPSPYEVSERVTEWTRMIDRDCSFQNRSRFEGLLEDARRKTADQLGVSADEIALVRNTSEGNCTGSRRRRSQAELTNWWGFFESPSVRVPVFWR